MRQEPAIQHRTNIVFSTQYQADKLDIIPRDEKVIACGMPILISDEMLEPNATLFLIEIWKHHDLDTIWTASKALKLWWRHLSRTETAWNEASFETLHDFHKTQTQAGVAKETIEKRSAAILDFYAWAAKHGTGPKMPFSLTRLPYSLPSAARVTQHRTSVKRTTQPRHPSRRKQARRKVADAIEDKTGVRAKPVQHSQKFEQTLEMLRKTVRRMHEGALEAVTLLPINEEASHLRCLVEGQRV